MRASRFRCTMGRAVACIPGIISCLALAQTHAVEWTAVERQYRKCVQENVDSSGCAVRHADALAHLGQPWDAILELESFVAAHPSDAPAVELYAELLQRVAKDVSGAERALRKATELTPGDPSLWRTLGALYAGQQKATEAVRCYEQALRLRPDDPLYLAGLAYSHGLNGEQEQAEREFRRALALNERLPHPSGDVPVLYGVFLRNAGSAAESIPQFTQALRWNARSWRIYYERALACERTGDLARAEADALQALAGAGERRDIHLLLLRIYRAKGDSAKVAEQNSAIEKLNAAEDSYYATAREMRKSLAEAEAAVTKGDCAAALPPYERVVRLLPSFYEAWFPLGVCYNQSGDRAKAEQALLTYLRYQPLSADGHSVLGLIYSGQRRFPEARAELQRALDIDPSSSEASTALARIEYQDKNYAAAAKLAAQAVTSDADAAADIYALAAEASLAAGDRAKALEVCGRGLHRWPGDEGLQRVHAALLTDCLFADSCRADLIHALQQNPSSLPYRKAAARAMILVNPWDNDTERLVRGLVTQFPGDAEVLVIEAVWNERRSRSTEAIASARQALAVAAMDSSARIAALDIIAESCDASGDTACARANFEPAWALNVKLGLPDPASALAWASFLDRNSEHRRSLAVLDEVLRRSPVFAPGRMARARQRARAGESKSAIEDASIALENTADPAVLEEAHALLARLYSVAGQTDKARQHEDWIKAHK